MEDLYRMADVGAAGVVNSAALVGGGEVCLLGVQVIDAMYCERMIYVKALLTDGGARGEA